MRDMETRTAGLKEKRMASGNDEGYDRPLPDRPEDREPPRAEPAPRRRVGGWQAYKPEQGKWTRNGTLLCGGALIAWGGYFVWEQLRVYEGDNWVSLLITIGIPLLFAVIFGSLLWWVAYVNRSAGDFMIATEGEMKKVNWSTRKEILGSTKVVILFTVLLAVFLFVVDIIFQVVFSEFGVLKK